MSRHIRRLPGRTAARLVLAAALSWAAGAAQAQNLGFGIDPGRVEVAVQPGEERTVAFYVEAPPSEPAERNRLMLSLSDWNLNEEASLVFADAGSLVQSASPWITYSPSSLVVASGERQLVRVTIRVPPTARDGVYRASVLIQQRPPAAPPQLGEHLLNIRLRYAFILYVLVGELDGRGEFSDCRLQTIRDTYRLACEMSNHGTLHVRPLLSVSVRDRHGVEVGAVRRHESTVVLPGALVREPLALPAALAPGDYEVVAQVDFRDGHPIQQIRKSVTIADPVRAASASAAPAAAQ